MIVKIHSRGAGSGSGPVDYLLGKDRQREQARVLRGNPEHVRELIDGCDFARAYTSGVLSFQEPDIADAEKSRLMDEWEHTLLTGLDCDQYACLWVEHRDKGRLELNFVIPNIELQSGKRLQPYFDRADRPRVNAWQTLTNDRLGLRDPNDPTYRRPLTQASDLPRDKQQAAEKITAGLMNLMQQGMIRSRQDVVTQLESYGLTVARETKSSISIADPDGGRNIRLKGMIYERDFKFGEGLRGEIEAAGAGYRAEREARVREAGDVYQRGTAIKLAEHQQRYPRAERQADGHDQNLRLSGDGVDIPLLCPADRYPGGIIWFQGTIITSRLSEMDSYSQQLESLKAKSGAGVTIYSDDKNRNTYGGAAEAGARRGNLHIDDRQHRGEIHGEITPSERPESRLSGFKTEDEQRKTASERLRKLTDKLRATAAGVAGQLQQLAAHVRDYLTGADAQRQGVSALEQSGRELARAGRELEQERQPLDALIAQHDRAREEKLREQQPRTKAISSRKPAGCEKSEWRRETREKAAVQG
ncbi:relaxase/mobilization nuclease domain-containing protein [Enterobacter cloacae]